MKNINQLTEDQIEDLIDLLKSRFMKNMDRHSDLTWEEIQNKLIISPEKLWSLYQMEQTGGEPDVIGKYENIGEYLYCDCAPESPKGRRSICYDHEALKSRKEYKPENSAINMAEEMGIEILTEKEYRDLQKLGKFDLKTSSWVKTPTDIRKLGGAIFCDRRYETVFVYHNGAESYYAARGFRGILRV